MFTKLKKNMRIVLGISPKEVPHQITVKIKPQHPYNSSIYTDNEDCYLARELKKQGYKDISVTGFGNTTIGNDHFKTKERFGSYELCKNFEAGIDTIVTLVKV